jgi:phosphatidylglycerol:prolipoprotein diacylglycerol transferase
MKVDLFSIGPITVHGYGLMIAIGVIAAYLVGEKRARKLGLNPDPILSITILCLIGGFIGAKLMFYLTIIPEIIADPSQLWKTADGFVVYGGIIAGIFTGYLYIRKKKLPFFKYFDLVMPSIALAQAFGRLGCLLAGCCYGVETESRFSLVFPEDSYAPSGVRLFPTQPTLSALNFLNFFALIFLAKRVKADGQVAALYLIFYSVGRFIIEFFRGDIERGSIGVLSTSQFISIFIFIFGIALFIIRGRQARAEKS